MSRGRTYLLIEQLQLSDQFINHPLLIRDDQHASFDIPKDGRAVWVIAKVSTLDQLQRQKKENCIRPELEEEIAWSA